MEDHSGLSSILYLSTLRVIQPARVQDTFRQIEEVWGAISSEVSREDIYRTHAELRANNMIVPVKKGSYALSQLGRQVADAITKTRRLDNLRLFLMKKQRRAYVRDARRYD